MRKKQQSSSSQPPPATQPYSVSPTLVIIGIVVAFICGYVASNLADIPHPLASAREDAAKSSEQSNPVVQSPGGTSEFPLGHMQPLGSHRQPSVNIPVIDYVPNSVDFYERFIRTRQPVLMRGAAKSMPAFKLWQDKQYLKDRFGDTLMKVEMRKTFDNTDFVKKVMNFSEFLDRYEAEDLYMDTPATHSTMLNDVLVPMCLHCRELSDKIASSHLLFSSGGTSSSYHFDGIDNLLSLLSGRKRVIIVDVAYQKHSYADDYISYVPLSPINPDAVDLVKFPLFKDVPYGVVEMEPGDILYNPSLLPHHVRSYDSPNIAVNIWFAPFDFEENVTSRYGFRSSKEVAAYNNALHAMMKKESPPTIGCNSEFRRLYSLLENSSKEDTYTPDEKARGDLEAFQLISGHSMPRMGFGSPRVQGEKARAAYVAALKAGYRMVDCAQLYDEEALGSAVQEVGIPRSELFIISKVHPKNFGAKKTLKSIDESLHKLKLDYIDLMLIHTKDCSGLPGCDKEAGSWQSAWQDMELAVEQGKIRSLGVSNFETVAEIEEVMNLGKGQVSVIQNYMDPFLVPTEVLQFCQLRNITFMAFGTLGRSYVHEEGMTVNPVLSNPAVREPAESKQCTTAQVVLRWAMQRGVGVIPSSENPVHMEINLNTFDIYLETEEMQALDSLVNWDPETIQDSIGSDDADGDNTVFAEKTATGLGHVADFYKEANLNQLNVFAGGDDGLFTAFHGQTGSILWRFMTFSEFGSSCIFSPDGTHIYFTSENRNMYSLDVVNGEKVWNMPTQHPFLATPRLSADASLLLAGNLGGTFYCIERATGGVRWKRKLADGEIWSTAAVGTVDGAEVAFVGVLTSGLHAVFVGNGSQVWRADVPGGVWSSPVVTPDGQHVIFAGQDGNVYRVRSRDGNVAWTWPTRGQLYSSALLTDNVVFGASDAGALFALDAQTGRKIWKVRLGSKVLSSPQLGPGGILVIGVTDHTVRGFHSSTGKRAWTFTTGHEVWATAAITSSGVVYIGSIDEHMYALNVTNGNLLWKVKSSPYAASPCVTSAYRNVTS